MTKEIEMINDGKQAERFVDLARKLVAVPKQDIDRRLEEERRQKDERKDAKRKA